MGLAQHCKYCTGDLVVLLVLLEKALQLRGLQWLLKLGQPILHQTLGHFHALLRLAHPILLMHGLLHTWGHPKHTCPAANTEGNAHDRAITEISQLEFAICMSVTL